MKSELKRYVMLAYLIILLVTPIFNLYSLSLVLFVVIGIFAGIVEMALYRKDATILWTLFIILGVIAVALYAIELGHAGFASAQPDLRVKGMTVTLLDWTDNSFVVDSGVTFIDFNENMLESPETRGAIATQLNWAIFGGGFMIALVAFLFWIVPTEGNFPAVVWTIFLFYHNFPLLISNDTTVAISNGWMSFFTGLGMFLILFVPVMLGAVYSIRKGEPIVSEA